MEVIGNYDLRSKAGRLEMRINGQLNYSGNSHDRRKARRKDERLPRPTAILTQTMTAGEFSRAYPPKPTKKTLWQRIKSFFWDKFFWTDHK